MSDATRAEQALRESEERYRTLFNSIDEGFCVVEIILDEAGRPADYRFLEVNRVFEQQTGLQAATGRTALELVPNLERRWIESYGRVALTGRAERFVEGSEAMGRWFDVYAFRVGGAGSRRVAILFTDITAQRRTEMALRETQSRFRLLADTVPALIWLTDEHDQATFVNAEYERFLGRPMSELLGGSWAEGVHPDDRTRYYEAFVSASARRERFESDFRFRRFDGEYRWMRTVGVPRFESDEFRGYVGSTIDIHESKLAEQAVRESEERFRNMADHAPVMVWVTEPDGVCTYLNKRWYEFTGQTPAEALGFGWLEATHPEDREHAGQIFLRANARREPFAIDYRLRRRDGTYAWAVDSAAPRFGPDGEFRGYIGSVFDITERKRHEAELMAANRMKDEFLATLSHELRTPLNAVIGWAHMLKTGTVPPAVQQKAYESLERNAKMQAQLVNDLLDVSRIISGKLDISTDEVDLAGIVAGALETVAPSAAGKQVTVRMVTVPGTELVVSGDAGRLRQVVWNLLANAVKFTPEGGRVDVELRKTGSDAEIVVRDTGQGIPPDFLPHVFERFRQADATTTRRHGGLGLGLAIVRSLVEAHGGTVSASSAGIGEGATFTIRLPLRRGEMSASLPADPVPDRSATPSLRGTRVLVVDDEDDARVMMSAVLESAQARVTVASSAREALAIVSRDELDVLLADVGMPGQDGYALIQAIRQLTDGPAGRIRAVAVTAYATAADRERALAAGFDRHFAKPIDPAGLIDTIVELIQ